MKTFKLIILILICILLCKKYFKCNVENFSMQEENKNIFIKHSGKIDNGK